MLQQLAPGPMFALYTSEQTERSTNFDDYVDCAAVTAFCCDVVSVEREAHIPFGLEVVVGANFVSLRQRHNCSVRRNSIFNWKFAGLWPMSRRTRGKGAVSV